MSKLQKLQCEQCAGKIDGVTLTCQSCGMQYRLDEDMTLVKIKTYNMKFHVLQGQISLPAYVLFDTGEKRFAEMTLNMMAENMASKILPFMELRTMYNPEYQVFTTQGNVRIAEPLVSTMPDVFLNNLRGEMKYAKN